MGRKWIKWMAIGLGAALGLVIVLALSLIGASAVRQARTYPIAPDLLVLHATPDRARGEHLVAIFGCQGCHAPDLGGQVIHDDFALGRVTARNLTRGGLASVYSTADFVRAIRYGVSPTGHSLIVMPSDAFEHINDADLASIIGYIDSAPPVTRNVPATRIGPLARILHVAVGFPLLSAEHTEKGVVRAMPAPGDTLAEGTYLANSMGCTTCHGATLGGGGGGAPNITRGGPLAAWSEVDFTRALRDGTLPDGTAIPDAMPWKEFRHSTDTELHALWIYLRTVPPVVPARK